MDSHSTEMGSMDFVVDALPDRRRPSGKEARLDGRRNDRRSPLGQAWRGWVRAASAVQMRSMRLAS